MLITVRLTESVQEYSSEGLFSEGKRSAGGGRGYGLVAVS